MKGFIFAGGSGSRLHPITHEIPKPLLPVKGKAVITYLTELYLKNGVTDIKINIPHNHRYIFQKWKKDNFFNEKIEFLVEKKQSGTFGPLKKVGRWFSEDIVVSNGDELKEIKIKDFFLWHKQRGAIATIGIRKNKTPSEYGVTKTSGDLIVKFTEKQKNSKEEYINSGIYVLSPEIKKYYPHNKELVMLEKDLFPILAKQKNLYGYKWSGPWHDIGTFPRWEEAIKKWKKK